MRPFLMLSALLAGACYGAPTPTTCHNKYVRDGRGDGYEDTYENCLARAEKRRAIHRAAARGEPTGRERHSIFPWRRNNVPAVVVNNQVTVEAPPPPPVEPTPAPAATEPPRAPTTRVFGRENGGSL